MTRRRARPRERSQATQDLTRSTEKTLGGTNRCQVLRTLPEHDCPARLPFATHAGVAEWQTRMVQVHVGATP